MSPSISRVARWSLPLILLAACASPAAKPEWSQEVAFEFGEKLGGCAVGDLATLTPGDEIALVSVSGHVWVVSRDGNVWVRESIADLPGEMIQCAIGDLLPGHPGDELVVCGIASGGEDDGGPGEAYVAWRDGVSWRIESLGQDEALVHAVCVGDLMPEHAGDEVLLAGYSANARIVGRDANGWQELARIPIPAPAKGAAIGLRGAVLVDAAGGLHEIWRDGSEWKCDERARSDGALARVAVEDGEVLFCANDGKLRLWRDGAVEVVYSSSDRLRGAVLADLDVHAEGVELATAGYDGRITLIRGDGVVWNPEHVGHDEGRFHHLATGLVSGLGRVLVGCGYSGHLIVVSPPRP